MRFYFLTDNSKYTWDDFIEKTDMGTIFHSIEWSIEKARYKWFSEFLMLEEKDNILGGSMVCWKKIPFLCSRIMTCMPVWNNDKDIFDTMSNEIIKIGQERKAIYLEFQSYLPEYINGIKVEKNFYFNDMLISKGFIKLPQKKATYWINLDRDEDEIFKNFGEHHRRDIRKAVREGVKIKIADNPNLADTFYDYYAKMIHYKKLKNVLSLSRDFFLNEFKTLLKNNKCKLFYAEYKGKIYNMAIISLFGNPMFAWGASIRTERQPPMGQLLHWEIIRWLKKKEYKIYDLGGSPGAIPQKGHPNYLVWRFKKKFNGDYVEFFPPFGYIFKKGQYWLFENMLHIYRKYSTIKKKIA